MARGDLIADVDFNGTDQLGIQHYTPSGTSAFPSAFDLGSGGTPANSPFPFKIQEFAPEKLAINAALGDTANARRLISAGIGVHNNFNAQALVRKANTAWGGADSRAGFCFRSTDTQVGSNETGDWYDLTFRHPSSTSAVIELERFSNGTPPGRTFWTSINTTGGTIAMDLADERWLGIEISDDSASIYWSESQSTNTTSGRTYLVSGLDLTFGGTVSSLNTSDNSSFGIVITNQGNVDGINHLEVLDFPVAESAATPAWEPISAGSRVPWHIMWPTQDSDHSAGVDYELRLSTANPIRLSAETARAHRLYTSVYSIP